MKSGANVLTVPGHKKRINCIVSCMNDKLFISASDDLTMKIWRFYDGKLLNTIFGNTSYLKHLVVSSDNKLLIVGS